MKMHIKQEKVMMMENEDIYFASLKVCDTCFNISEDLKSHNLPRSRTAPIFQKINAIWKNAMDVADKCKEPLRKIGELGHYLNVDFMINEIDSDPLTGIEIFWRKFDDPDYTYEMYMDTDGRGNIPKPYNLERVIIDEVVKDEE